MASVNTVLATLTNAINQREIIFAPLPKLVTRVVSAVAASEVSKQVIADVQTIARKLQGRRATPKKKDDPATPQNESAGSISAVQLSFDSQVENLDKLVQLLSAQSAYKPNETDLTVDALKELLNNMRAFFPSESTSQKFKISRRVSTTDQCVAVGLADIKLSCSSQHPLAP